MFCAMSTQWRYAGMDGRRTGLEYPTLFALMDREGLTGQDWQDRFDDIRALEAQALDTLSENNP